MKKNKEEMPEDVANGVKEKKLSPQEEEQRNMINAAITDMIYNEQTKESIQKMLSGGEISMTLPKTTNAIFGQFEKMASKQGGKMPLSIKLSGGVHTFTELLELGAAMGIVDPNMSEEEMQPLLKETIQQYIQLGLKDKSIDPIELQTAVEPYLSDEETEIGLNMGSESSVPTELTQQQANQGVLQNQMNPLQVENEELKRQNAKTTESLQGVLKGGQ